MNDHDCCVPACTNTAVYISHNGPTTGGTCACLCVAHFDDGWMG